LKIQKIGKLIFATACLSVLLTLTLTLQAGSSPDDSRISSVILQKIPSTWIYSHKYAVLEQRNIFPLNVTFPAQVTYPK
jgi:hypothetical protein